MPRQVKYELRSFGWENDPEQEIYKFSTLDYLVACVYVSYATFFRIDKDADKAKVARVLKQGLERTLSQVRHFCGVIKEEPGDASGYAFVKKRDNTVEFIMQYLEEPEDEGKYPSFSQIEESGCVSRALGDLEIWSIAPMTCKCLF